MSLAFLAPVAPGAPPARSPLERAARAAGAQFEERGGWRVATRYPGESDSALRERVAWGDMSHLGKTEVHEGLAPGTAVRRDGAWWCPITARRTLVVGDPRPEGVDVTTTWAALLVAGPLARETLARLTALDLRPASAPPASFRPGSVARVPAMVLVERADRFLVLFGAALADYLWTAVADAATSLGGAPVGLEALGA